MVRVSQKDTSLSFMFSRFQDLFKSTIVRVCWRNFVTYFLRIGQQGFNSVHITKFQSWVGGWEYAYISKECIISQKLLQRTLFWENWTVNCSMAVDYSRFHQKVWRVNNGISEDTLLASSTVYCSICHQGLLQYNLRLT